LYYKANASETTFATTMRDAGKQQKCFPFLRVLDDHHVAVESISPIPFVGYPSEVQWEDRHISSTF
jgi:hypothetical protein